MEKPKIFISSTCYDFRDLRSALKFYIENIGFEVLLSEFNDFPISNNENSFTNCLKTISKCDYYILLIGSRVGGYFDETNKISITRREYQEAYNLFLENKIKIIIFIRDEIWTIRDDRIALENFLTNEFVVDNEISINQIHNISNHKSKMLTDSETIFNFIDEVSRKCEMDDAIKGLCSLPKGNWIRSFKNFSEIILALKIELEIDENIERKMIVERLKKELFDNLKNFYQKNKGKIEPITTWSKFARKSITNSLQTASKMKTDYIRWLGMFSITYKIPNNSSYIKLALSKGIFLKYDNFQNKFVSSEIHKALGLLINEIEQLESSSKLLNENFSQFRVEILEIGKNKVEYSTIDNLKILIPLIIHDRIQNIIILTKFLLNNIDVIIDSIDDLKLLPRSPFEEENELFENEKISDKDLLDLLSNN